MATKSKRQAISKKARFEVFKRDGFACQYCGAHPPGVLLHVDHIHPVADGGTNAVDNLVTACEPCNLGKGARLLSAVPVSLADKAAEAAEREAQIEGYGQVMRQRAERIEDETWEVLKTLTNDPELDKCKAADFRSTQIFVSRLGLWPTLEAAQIARARFNYFSATTFRYFCGICWSKIREVEDGPR